MKKTYNYLLNSFPLKWKEATRFSMVGTLSGIFSLGKGKRLQAFTLVELIVVITILAILGTIAFISLQGYSRDARDSVRISNMSKMKSSLELFYVDSGKYPLTTNAVNITYSGAVAWTQGYFGDETYKNVEKLDKIPTDPLTSNKYVYSVTNTRQEYEIAGIMEGEVAYGSSPIAQQEQPHPSPLLRGEAIEGGLEVNAAEKTAVLKITGNYNGKILKVSTGGVDYVLAVPSIINGSGTTLEEIISNNYLAYDGYKNLPFEYNGGQYEVLGEDDLNLVNKDNYVVFEGDLSILKDTTQKGIDARKIFIDSLKSAYVGTQISGESEIEELLYSDTSIEVVTEFVAGTLINNNLGGELEIVPVDVPMVDFSGPDGSMTLVYEGLVSGDVVELPFKGLVSISSIDWGDDGVNGCPTVAVGSVSCTYTNASKGNYTIQVVGKSTGFGDVYGALGIGKLTQVSKLEGMLITDMSYAFYNASNFVYLDSDLDTSNFVNIQGMFRGASSFNQSVSNFDTSNVINIAGLFRDASSFNQSVSNFDTSNVIYMRNMFYGASSFNQSISNFDTSKVTSMRGMFYGASSFNQHLSNFNTSKVTNMQAMFYGASSFNQSISNFDTSNVTNMSYMFYGASSFNQSVSNFDTSKVTNMQAMFYGASSFNQSISNFDTSNVTNMGSIFYLASNFNQSVSNFDTSKVTNMNNMFNGAVNFNQSISNFDTSNVISMDFMFRNASSFNQSISNFDTSKVTSMRGMFYGASSFNQHLSNFNTSNVANMGSMFYGAISFNQPFGNFDISNTTNIANMFNGASSFNKNISCWNVEKFLSEPSGFSVGSALISSNKPLWGTDGSTGICD